MKKLSALLILAALTTASALPPVDCNKGISVDNRILYYSSQAQFPKESETVYVYYFGNVPPVKALNLCGFTIKPDPKTRTVSVSAPKFSDFPVLTSGRSRASQPFVYFVVHRSDQVESGSSVLFDLSTYQLTYTFPKQSHDLPYTIGVKLDDGPLRPLYFGGQMTPIQIPRNVKTIDIYVKAEFNNLLSWPRITINPQKSSLRLYEDAVFPAK